MLRPLAVGPQSPAGQALRRAWQPVCRVIDLPAGAARRIIFLGEQWTLLRTPQGQPGLIGAACPHRGTALALGRWDGAELACMHHGWRFDADGACRHRPDGGPLAPARVRAAVVREHLGLCFAWLGEGDPPALPRWPAFEAPGTLRVLPPEVWPCPFHLRLENSLDLAHLPSTHHASGVGALLGPPRTPRVTSLDDGLLVTGDSDAPVPLRMRLLLPDALCFPTPVSETAGWRDHLVWRVPLDAHSCVSFTLTHVPDTVPDHAAHAHDQPVDDPHGPSPVARTGAAVLRGEVHLDALRGEASLTEIEDYVALCGVVRDGEGAPLDGELLGPHDGPIATLRRRWAALERGEARPWSGLPAPEPGEAG